MAPPSVQNEAIKKTADLYLQAVDAGFLPRGHTAGVGRKTAVQRVADALKMGNSAIQKRLMRAEALGLIPPAAPPEEAAVKIDPLAARQERNQVQALAARVAELETELIAERQFVQKATAALATPARPMKWPKPALVGKASKQLVPLLFASDFQAGEVVRGDQIDGLNTYNIDVFKQRYAAMIDKTILLMKHHTGADRFPTAIYCNGGDNISGEIHEDLATTNDLSSIPAVAAVYEAEVAGIRRLADAFGRLDVYRVNGNHDRTTHKPRSKNAAEHSFGWLLSFMLAKRFADDKRVNIVFPRSADAFFKVFGWNFLLTHGDRMGSSGGQGFIGPAATIARGHQRLVQNWAQSGHVIDCVLTGHLHTSVKLSHGYANGSLAGYTQFGRDIRHVPAPAQQWLLGVHPEHLIANAFELNLSPRPRRQIQEAA